MYCLLGRYVINRPQGSQISHKMPVTVLTFTKAYTCLEHFVNTETKTEWQSKICSAI